MKADVAKDMEWSSQLFEREVWPIVQPRLGGGEFLQMEGSSDIVLAQLLDTRAGIDGWYMDDRGVRGVACRVQAGQDWRTFTIRMSRDSGAETEFDKRRRAIASEGGWIYPFLTIQAYAATKSGPVISIGVAKTRDLIEFIELEKHVTRRTTNATFAVCGWADLKSIGYNVHIIEPQQAKISA